MQILILPKSKLNIMTQIKLLSKVVKLKASINDDLDCWSNDFLHKLPTLCQLNTSFKNQLKTCACSCVRYTVLFFTIFIGLLLFSPNVRTIPCNRCVMFLTWATLWTTAAIMRTTLHMKLNKKCKIWKYKSSNIDYHLINCYNLINLFIWFIFIFIGEQRVILKASVNKAHFSYDNILWPWPWLEPENLQLIYFSWSNTSY